VAIVVSTLFVIAVVAVFVRLPVRRVKSNEGIFAALKHETDPLTGKKFVVYEFDHACWNCLETGRRSAPSGLCRVVIPERAIMIGGPNPWVGDSIEVIEGKNIFGRTIRYRVNRTDFAERFAERQFMQERVEWGAYRAAFERRMAAERGLSIEEYREVVAEEAITQAMQWLDMSREEVLTGGYHMIGEFNLLMERRAREASREKGVPVTRSEAAQEFARSIDDAYLPSAACVNLMTSGSIPGEHDYIGELFETGTIKEAWALEHLLICRDCSADFQERNRRYQESQGPDCFTESELGMVLQNGMLPPERQAHQNDCYYCQIRFERCSKRHLEGAPSPFCLSEKNLHEIHATGRVPESCAAHVAKCLRCKRGSEQERQAYLDRVAPWPDIPKTRLESLRAKQERESESTGSSQPS
jgi:hypothetical protein